MEQIPPFEMKFAKLPNNERYAYREYGDPSSKTLLLLHGNFTTSLFFEVFATELSKFYYIIAPDMRGYGYTTYNTPLESLEDLCCDLKSFMEVLKIERFNLLGWSAGGCVAQLFACKYPSIVEKLILVGSLGPRGPMMKGADKKVMKTKDDFRANKSIMELVRTVTGKFKSGVRFFIEGAGFQNKELPSDEKLKKYVDEVILQRNIIDMFYSLNHFNISTEDNGVCQGTGQIKDMQGPCLLVHGSEDSNVFCMNSWEIKKYLLRKAEIEMIKGARHFLFEPGTASTVAEIVQKFLDKE